MPRDTKKDLIDHLRSEFDTSAISVPFDVSDDIAFEAYDDVEKEVYVTPVSEDSTSPGGGETQYTGIDPSGAGGIQDIVTSVQIDCWGGDEEADVYMTNNTHPDIVANELSTEVHRILFNTDESSSGPAIPTGYDWMNAQPPSEADDTEENPTTFRDIVIARTKHTVRPQ